jgi:hypothetical protein
MAMSDIVCAIRGGAGSRAVQNAAIHQALAGDEALVFLYVIDRRVLEACEASMQPSMRNELYWMGKTLVRIAVARAQAAGLSRVTWAVREGEVREEIVRAVSARPTRLLLIGAPRRETDKGPDPAASFAAWVQATTGVAVEIVAPLPTK